MSDPIGAAAGRLSTMLSSANGQSVGKYFDQLTQTGQQVSQNLLDSMEKGGDTGAIQLPLGPSGATGSSFGDSLTRALNDISAQQDSAAETLSAFLRGENVELHQVMAATEEAQISLQMLIEVRNKFTDAYRTLSNMQG
jgi:flagellar hook-basal body complex protein FliE